MRPRPLLLLALASLGFGAGAVITKAILNLGVAPMTVIPGRYLFATVVLLSGLLVTGRLRLPEPKAWRPGLVLGVINMAAPTILTTVGLVYMPASITAMLVALIPLTTVVAAHYLVEGEPVRASLLPGFVIALLGCVLLIRGDTTTGSRVGLGVALILAGVLAASVGGALSRRFAVAVAPVQLVIPQFVGAGIVVLATTVIADGLSGLGRLDATQWWLLALSGAVATALPFVAILWLSEIATAAKTSLVAYLVPLIGVAGSVTLLGEKLTTGLIVGGVLILAGVVVAERAERRHDLAVGAS